MFLPGKLFWIFGAPTDLLLVLLWVGAALQATSWSEAGRVAMCVAALGFLVVIFLPIGRWLLLPLERRFAKPTGLQRVDGIVVPGGALEPRLRAAALLALEFPGARLIYSSADGTDAALVQPEGEIVRRLARALGIGDDRLMLEDQSRNTMDNAWRCKALAQAQPGEVWLLLTSARHMPRAIGAFRAQGWPILAYPVDFIAAGRPDSGVVVAASARLTDLDEAAHEWMGLLAYRLLGKTDRLFPRP